MTVDTVTLRLSKKNPPDLFISAQGKVPSSGWKNAELSAWVYVSPPADGIQDFDFVAEAPTGIVLTVVLPISAELSATDVDISNFWGKGRPLRGVRVHAATNKLESPLDEKAAEKLDTQVLS